MGRFKVTYPRQRDPVSESRNQAVSQATIQRQAQASAYAAARFNEWQANSQQRQESLQYRNQILQSQAEMAGLKQMSDLYNQGEIDRETKMYLAGMPALREQLKNANIKPGSEEYRAEIAAFAQHIPHAFAANPDIRKDLHELSRVDATAQEIANKIKTTQDAFALTNQRPTSFTTTAAGGVDVKATRPIDEGLKAVGGLSPTEFLNHVNAKQGKFDDQGKFTQNLNPGEQANAIQFQAGAKKDDASQLVTHSIPLQQFNQLRSGLGVAPLSAYVAPAQNISPTPQPSPTTPASPTPDQTPIPSPTPQPAANTLRRYNPETGELE